MSLKVKSYTGRPCYYLRGTVRAGVKTSRPIFESTGIRLGEPRGKQKAEEVCSKRQEEIRDELLNGPRILDVSWSEAAVEYCAWRKQKRDADYPELVGTVDPEAGYVLRLTEYFKSIGVSELPLSQIGEMHIEGYLRIHLQGRKPSYLKRCRSNFVAVMNHAKAYKLCSPSLVIPVPKLPKFEENAKINKHFSDETVVLFIECAPPHSKLFFSTAFTLGLRPGELLFAERTPMLRAEAGRSGICLLPGMETLFLARTKTELPVERVIPPELAEALRRALAARKDRYDALFLTDKKRPYKRGKTSRGFRFRNAWNGTCERVAAELDRRAAEARLAGDEKLERHYVIEADSVRRSTGHWSRHTMISNAVMNNIPDRMIMKMSGHLGSEMIGRYTHLRDENVRDAARVVAPMLSVEKMLPKPKTGQ